VLMVSLIFSVDIHSTIDCEFLLNAKPTFYHQDTNNKSMNS